MGPGGDGCGDGVSDGAQMWAAEQVWASAKRPAAWPATRSDIPVAESVPKSRHEGSEVVRGGGVKTQLDSSRSPFNTSMSVSSVRIPLGF